MNQVVVDAAVALAWCFPDETSEYAEGVLISLEGKTLLEPTVWSLEIANAILVGVRKKRLNPPEVRQFMVLLSALSLVQDVQPAAEQVNNVVPLARQHELSAYDAAYLELSIRHGAPLATLDSKLQKAAKHSGVKLFPVKT